MHFKTLSCVPVYLSRGLQRFSDLVESSALLERRLSTSSTNGKRFNRPTTLPMSMLESLIQGICSFTFACPGLTSDSHAQVWCVESERFPLAWHHPWHRETASRYVRHHSRDARNSHRLMRRRGSLLYLGQYHSELRLWQTGNDFVPSLADAWLLLTMAGHFNNFQIRLWIFSIQTLEMSQHRLVFGRQSAREQAM